MKNKKTASLFVIIGIIITILYIIFAIKPLGEEFQFIPEWKIDITNPSIERSDEVKHPFKLGQAMGYFTDSGKVTSFISFPFKATISESRYASYMENNFSCDYYNANGEKEGTIKEYGFPHFDGERMYIFNPGGNSFQELDPNGKKIWEFESTSPVTAFDSSEGGCIAGFADGSIAQFDHSGKILQQFSPGGSEFQIISGAAVSSDGEYIAIVSGQNKERFVLAKKEDAHSKIVFHEFSDSSKPYQKLVKFSKDNSKVYYDFCGKLGIADTKKCKSSYIKIKGQAISLKENDSCVFVLTKDKDEYTVYVIEKNSSLTGKFSFKAKSAFIQTYENVLFVGKDSTISKINIFKK